MYYNYESLAALGIFIVMLVIFVGVVCLLYYLFDAIGIYKIAKRRGDRQAWLAFIPIASNYTRGGIYDNINGYTGKKSSFRFILLALSIVSSAGVISYVFSFFSNFIVNIPYLNYYDDTEVMSMLVNIMVPTVLMCLASVLLKIFIYIANYKIYNDYSDNGVLFTVLDVLFGIAPFFIFAIRNNNSKTIAYANRVPWTAKPVPAYQPMQPPVQPVQPPVQPVQPPVQPVQPPVQPVQPPVQPVQPPVQPMQPPVQPPQNNNNNNSNNNIQ